MGIVNVTPDSFSDGGHFSQTDAAAQHALKLASQGATILDIGGESTRPYSTPVEVEQELSRVIPVIEKVVSRTDVPISIDTSKSVVAAAAIAAGAEIINDVTGLEGDPKMIDVAVESGAGVCAMHMQGTPQNMQLDSGIGLKKICLDPGIGFGKSHDHNLQLIRDCHRFHELGCPILIGHSRKGFIAKLLGDKAATIAQRDAGTLAITLQLARQGIQIIRVHEVANTVAAMRVQEGLASQGEQQSK